MYLTQDFIQNKFITGQNGQRFFFTDKTVIDLVNLEQRLTIFAEQDSYIKVFAREAFGVNLKIQLCRQQDNGTTVCDVESQQIGNVEMLTADVKKHTKQFLRLSYFDSVLAFHSYRECPHITLEVSMISSSEAKLFDSNPQQSSVKGIDDIRKVFNNFTEKQTPVKLD